MKGRFSNDSMVSCVPTTFAYDVDGYSERSYFGSLIGFLHPYNVLRLLAENERNLHASVEWRYGPLVCNGWAREGEFVSEARRTQTFLIATEGSSDTHVIKHAMYLLTPPTDDESFFLTGSDPAWFRAPFPRSRPRTGCTGFG